MRASIQSSKALWISEKSLTNLARSPLLVGPRKKKTNRGQRSAFPSENSRFAPLILAHRGAALPWLVEDRAALHPRQSGAYPPDRALLQALRDSAPFLSRVATSRRAPKKWNSEEARTWEHHHPQPTIIPPSTNRQNREDTQLPLSLGGEPGPTPAGKTLPHDTKHFNIFSTGIGWMLRGSTRVQIISH